MNVRFTDLSSRFKVRKEKYIKALEKVLDSGQFIGGSFVRDFEEEIEHLLGIKHVVGVGSGTDALFLLLKYFDFKPGSEIITVPNSYLATVSTIFLNNLKPVYASIDPLTLQIDTKSIEKLITPKTVAIMGVHLTGSPCDINALYTIAKNYKLKLLEDFSQSFGAKIDNKYVGTISDASAASLHPLKNLPCIGDGGIICTNNTRMSEWLIKARSHGHPHRDECDFWSFNMRLDSLQAVFAQESLKDLDTVLKKRKDLADIYLNNLQGINGVETLNYKKNYTHTFHTFIILVKHRENLIKFLKKNDIEVVIHYPKLIPELKAHSKIIINKTDKLLNKRVLSLPISEEHTYKEVLEVCNKIKEFFHRE